MSEPEPMKQIHDIRHKMYEETKHLSDKDFLEYYRKKSEEAQKQMKKIKPAKDLKTFFLELKKQQAS
ncbi:MAG: hypothetical protein HYY52_04460 [Candidatus Melainabacteria bacterium]|nr:hypothetical protein [Candidatus Melainabacteria bacterium]